MLLWDWLVEASASHISALIRFASFDLLVNMRIVLGKIFIVTPSRLHTLHAKPLTVMVEANFRQFAACNL